MQQGKPASKLQYRAPLFVCFYVGVGAVIPLTLLACYASDARGAHLEVSPALASQLEAVASGRVSLVASPRVCMFYLMNGLYHGALHIGLSLQGVRVLAGVAWVAHVVQAVYGFFLCRQCHASNELTSAYTFMIFVGGFTQLVPLTQEARRYQEALEKSD